MHAGGRPSKQRGRRRVELAVVVVLIAAVGWTAFATWPADGRPAAAPADGSVESALVATWDAAATVPFEETGRRVRLETSTVVGPVDVRVDLATPTVPRVWRGVGGALTDASATLLARHPDGLDLLVDPDVPGGAALDIVRLPLSATDFSTTAWTWEPTDGRPVPPPEMAPTLAVLDEIVARRPDIEVIGAAWTAPPELRTHPHEPGGRLTDVDGYGRLLLGQVAALRERGVPLSAISLGNEPGVITDAPSLSITDEQLLDLARTVGRELDSAGVELLALDHNWADVDRAARLVASGDFDAVAFHCYAGDPSRMAEIEVPTLVTECTATTGPWHSSVGWMARELVGDAVGAGSTGLVMWNLALDPDHGPKASGGCDDCRGLVTIDGTSAVLTPEFRVLSHLSAAADPGAAILDAQRIDGLPVAAFVNPDGSIGIFGHNDRPEPVTVSLALDGDHLLDLEVPSWAIFSARS